MYAKSFDMVNIVFKNNYGKRYNNTYFEVGKELIIY